MGFRRLLTQIRAIDPMAVHFHILIEIVLFRVHHPVRDVDQLLQAQLRMLRGHGKARGQAQPVPLFHRGGKRTA